MRTAIAFQPLVEVFIASNFDFLQNRYPNLYEHAAHAESLTYSAPRASCFYTCFTLERAVHWLYENNPYLQLLLKAKSLLAH